MRTAPRPSTLIPTAVFRTTGSPSASTESTRSFQTVRCPVGCRCYQLAKPYFHMHASNQANTNANYQFTHFFTHFFTPFPPLLPLDTATSSVSAAQYAFCDDALATATYGVIHSHFGFGDHANNIDCTFTIIVPSGSYVSLYVEVRLSLCLCVSVCLCVCSVWTSLDLSVFFGVKVAALYDQPTRPALCLFPPSGI